MKDSATYNPGDLKHATVVIRKSERGLSPKDGKERANTTHSVASKKAESVAANVGGLYESGKHSISINETRNDEEEEEDGLPQTEEVAILSKHPSKSSNRNRYMLSANPVEDASMVDMNATVASEKQAMFGTFQKKIDKNKSALGDTFMTNDDNE
jgi:hypothetical protein